MENSIAKRCSFSIIGKIWHWLERALLETKSSGSQTL